MSFTHALSSPHMLATDAETAADSADYSSVLASALRADMPTMSDEAIETIRRDLVVRRFAKKTTIIRGGERPRLVFVVVEGWVREYYVSTAGQTRNVRFIMPGFGCGMQRLDASIDAGANTTLLSMSYPRFCQIVGASPEWKEYETRVLKRLLRESQHRERELLVLDALGRYEALLQAHPELADVVPQREIASYLGITPVHLSRIRRGRVQRPSLVSLRLA